MKYDRNDYSINFFRYKNGILQRWHNDDTNTYWYNTRLSLNQLYGINSLLDYDDTWAEPDVD